MITAKGIYLDLEDSTYFYRYERYKFYFSSKFYRGNFIKKVENFIKSEKIKFETKYNTIVTDPIFFAFVLYSKIEKRGFRVEQIDYSKTSKEYITSMPFVEFKLI